MKKSSPTLAAGALIVLLSAALFLLWYTDTVGSTFTTIGGIGLFVLSVAVRLWHENRGINEATREQQH